MTRSRASCHPARRTALVAVFALASAGPTAAAPARDATDVAGPSGPSMPTRVAVTRAQRSDPLRILPSACRFGLARGGDAGTFYGRRCLVAEFAGWPFLPDMCERRLDLGRRRPAIAAYDATCLAAFGFGPDDGRPPPTAGAP